jgi:hypothetical protein
MTLPELKLNRSVQIAKSNGTDTSSLRLDEKTMDTIANIDKSFEIIGDIKAIPYTHSVMPEFEFSHKLDQMNRKNYYNNSFYYSGNIPAIKTDTIYNNYLVLSGFFTEDVNVSFIVSLSENGSFLVNFPIKSSFNNADGLQKIDDFFKELKQIAFPRRPNGTRSFR